MDIGKRQFKTEVLIDDDQHLLYSFDVFKLLHDSISPKPLTPYDFNVLASKHTSVL